MSYTDAPACQLLASHCIMCSRPLLDAQSVEAGIGPVCREKIGYNSEPGPQKGPYQHIGSSDPDSVVEGCLKEGNRRGAANALVSFAARTNNKREAARAAEQVGVLGFDRVSSSLLSRLAQVSISISEDRRSYEVKAPFVDGFAAEIRKIRGQWDKERKLHVVPVSAKRLLFMRLSSFYKGSMAIGPKGWFVL